MIKINFKINFKSLIKEQYHDNNSTSGKNHAHGTQIAKFQEVWIYFIYPNSNLMR